MSPPEQWSAGKCEANLLARARVRVEDYDHKFAEWRALGLKDACGEKCVHPIPVVLFGGETEEQYEADLVSSFAKTKDGIAPRLATDPKGQRNQRMQYTVDWMRKIRADRGIPIPKCAGNSRTVTKLAGPNGDSGGSPSVAPQRRQQDRGHPRAGARQAPKSSARSSSHTTSPGSEPSYPFASPRGGTPYDSGARRDCQSLAQVVGTSAYSSDPVSDALSRMVLSNASSIGGLQQQLAALRSQMMEENALLRMRIEKLKTTVRTLQSQQSAERDRGKRFHAKYAPRVKALWSKHNALAYHVAREEDDLSLSDWDENPQ